MMLKGYSRQRKLLAVEMGQKGVPPKAPLLDHRARLSQPEQSKSPRGAQKKIHRQMIPFCLLSS
jgi:hypothetical protein